MKKKIQFIIETLHTLFPHPEPFLQYKNHFTLLVAVLLSGNSTDRMVNRVTPALFAKADSPEKMATLSEEEIKAIIRPCGLSNTKAKAIKALSEVLRDQYGGQVPASLEALEALPHVGRKTASVVLMQAFGIPTFPVDTHIMRLAHRWGLSSKKNRTAVSEDLMKIFPKHLWPHLHLQMIAYGRQYCPARGHILSNCPICKEL
jgi:endonuclease-3